MCHAKPIACTLSNAQRAARGSDWQNALRNAGAQVRDTPRGVLITLSGNENAVTQIRDLVRAEQQCCAWMNLDLTVDEASIRLSVTSDSNEGTVLIREMMRLSA